MDETSDGSNGHVMDWDEEDFSSVGENLHSDEPALKHLNRIKGFTSQLYSLGRKDRISIENTEKVSFNKQSRMRVQDETIYYDIHFIFQAVHVQLLSRGTKRIQYEEKWRRFP